MKKLIPLTIAFATLFGISASAQEKKEPSLIRGTVQDASTKAPLSGIHVYIIKGEEEAITDSQGNFSIRSWQSFPVRIQAAGKGYATKEVQLSGSRQQALILLPKTNH